MRGSASSWLGSSSLRLRLGLLLRSLRWHAGSSFVFLVVATAAVAAATAGPLYLAAAQQDILYGTLAQASVQRTSLSVFGPAGMAGPALLREMGPAPRGHGGLEWFRPPLVTQVVGAGVSFRGRAVASDLVWRTAICAHLRFVSGTCPSAGGAVAMSARSAAFLGARVGQDIEVAAARGRRVREVVAGLYVPVAPSSSYFSGQNFFPFGTGTSSVPRIDALIGAPAALLRAAPSSLVSVAELRLDTSDLKATDVPSFESAVTGLEARLGSHFGLHAESAVISLLAGVSSQQHSLETSVTVIEIQLLLLVLLVLYGVSVRASEERRHDLELADLRGHPRRSVAWLACKEPAALTIAAVPLGLLVAWGVIRLVADAAFGTRSVTIDSLAIAACVAGGTGTLVASAAASLDVIRRREGVTASVRARRREGLLVLAGDAAVVALALAALTQLLSSGVGSGGSEQPLAAAAPALVALALALVAARAVPLAAKLLARATALSPKIALSLCASRIARGASIIRQSVVLALAVSLSVFAVAGYVVAAGNRTIQADYELGAAEVLAVRVPSSVDFLGAVRRADPSGREAMAAQVESVPTGSLLAVDAERFAAVATWPAGISPRSARAVERFLDPAAAPEVMLSGPTLSALIGLPSRLRPPPELTINLFNTEYGALESLTIGLRQGSHTYRVPTLGACSPRCRLVSLSLSWAPAANGLSPADIVTDLESINVGQGAARPSGRLDTTLSHPADWRPVVGSVSVVARRPDPSSPAFSPTSSPTVVLAPGAPFLAASWRLVPGQPAPVLQLADLPAVIPAVATGLVAAANAGSIPPGSTVYPYQDLDGSPISVNGRVQVPALPQIGTDGILMNLAWALRAERSPDNYSVDQVWLASTQPRLVRPVMRRLAQEGITVASVERASSISARLAQSGPALAFELFLFAAGAGALIAATSLLYAIAVISRRRSIEMVALEASGLRRRTTVRALRAELGTVAAVGTVSGIVAGVVSARLALPSIPEFASSWHVPILAYGAPLVPVLVTSAALAAAFTLAVLAGVHLVSRKASVDKLRISQR